MSTPDLPIAADGWESLAELAGQLRDPELVSGQLEVSLDRLADPETHRRFDSSI